MSFLLFEKKILSSSFASLGRCCCILLIDTKWPTTFFCFPRSHHFQYLYVHDVFIEVHQLVLPYYIRKKQEE
jgi:hypothetical protein